MFKRIIFAIFVAFVCFSFAGCSGNDKDNTLKVLAAARLTAFSPPSPEVLTKLPEGGSSASAAMAGVQVSDNARISARSAASARCGVRVFFISLTFPHFGFQHGGKIFIRNEYLCTKGYHRTFCLSMAKFTVFPRYFGSVLAGVGDGPRKISNVFY